MQKRDGIILLSVLGVSLSLNVFWGLKIRQLEVDIAMGAPSTRLSAGVTIPPLTVQDSLGNKIGVNYGNSVQPTVLYIFSPTCTWCERNRENINMLVSAREDSHRFIGLSLTSEGLSEYSRSGELNLPILGIPTPDSYEALRLGLTPQTIVVSSDGVVLKNWIGAYRGTMAKEVEEYFDLELPGLIRLEENR